MNDRPTVGPFRIPLLDHIKVIQKFMINRTREKEWVVVKAYLVTCRISSVSMY